MARRGCEACMARSAGGRVRPPSAQRGLRRDGGHEDNQSKTVYFRALIAAGHACRYLVLPNDSGACRPSWTCCVDRLGLVPLRSPARGERGWRGVDARPAWRDRLGDGFAPRLRNGGYGATGATKTINLRRSTSVPSSPPVTHAATLCCRMTLEPVDRLGLVLDRLGLVSWTCSVA